MKIVAKAFLRYILRRPGLNLLQLLGIACGVAGVIGMVTSSRAALASFNNAIEFLRGKATHSIERVAGAMEERLLVYIARDPAVEWVSPVIDRQLRLRTGELVRILGIDPFLDRKIRPEIGGYEFREKLSSCQNELFTFFTEDRAVLISANLYKTLRINEDGFIETNMGPLRVKGTFSNPSGEPLILMDIGNAQRLYSLGPQIDRIDLIVIDEVGFRKRWGNGFFIQSGHQKKETFSAMLGAFRLNLEALSLLALLVGVFLIYNTAMFAVISRRRDTGILRSLGASRREIVVAFIFEVFLLGGAGGLLGSVGGFLLSRFFTQLMGNTISDLYFFLKPEPPAWSNWIPAAGITIGLGATIIGAFVPLLELAKTDPVKALSGRGASTAGSRAARRAATAGLAGITISLLFLLQPDTHVYVDFGAIFVFLMSTSCLVGIILIKLDPFMVRTLSAVGGLAGKIAARNISRNLSRTGVAVAAFMVALSMFVGLGVMIGSFRHSLIWWMDTQILGDLFVGKVGENDVPEEFYLELLKIPGMGGINPYRNVQVVYRGVPITVNAIDASVLKRFTRFAWLKGGNEKWDEVKDGAVVVSESFSRRFHVKEDDTIVLEGLHGEVPLKVAGIFYDYTTEHGLVMMDRSTYLNIYGDRTLSSLSIFIHSTEQRKNEILAEVRRLAAERGLPVRTQAELRGNILQIFDNTFAITRSMRALSIVVAFFGISGALLTLFIERRREFGIYRSLGFSAGLVARMTLLEGLGMGSVSYVLSTGTGTALAWMLIKVINLKSFNWTIFYFPSLDVYLLAGITATTASLAAAAYPIWEVYRTYPQLQIREE